MLDSRRWFHVVISTYGSWLQGDPRGFRTRHHREHVEGDYKNPPPPGSFANYLRRNRASLKQEPVVIPRDLRPAVGAAVRDKLQALDAYVLSISAGGQHLHCQVKMPPAQTRTWVGHAKRHTWFELRDRGWVGRLFAAGGKFKPIRDRKHQINTYHYILEHAAQGAWVWSALTDTRKSP
jgi:hypothetical protein